MLPMRAGQPSAAADGTTAHELPLLPPILGISFNSLAWALSLPQVLRVSEELLRVSVLDDASLAVVARGCPRLRQVDLVQVCVGAGGGKGGGV